MKKISYILMGILAISIFSIGIFFLVSIVFRDEEEGVLLTSEQLKYLKNPNVEFSGKSEHFSFSTGKIVFDAETLDGRVSNYLLVDDFEQHTKIDDLSYLSLTRYIGDEERLVFEDNNPKNILNKKLKAFGFFDAALVDDPNGQFESSYFSMLKEESFKEKFKLELVYCQTNNKCYIEEFEIDYQKKYKYFS